MSFTFNVVTPQGNPAGNGDGQKIDFNARTKYLAEKVGGSKTNRESVIGIISGIIDLGLQVEDDAKMEWKGTDAEKAEIEAKAARGETQEYFETLPNDKKVPTLYKRWPVKPSQKVALTVDFPSYMLDQGQFFGDDSGTLKPLRMLLNGEFYQKGVGRIVGKPYSLKESRNDDGSWSLKANSQLYKLAQATGVLENGRFKPAMIGNLLGKAALFEIAVYGEQVGDKLYLQEDIKFAGQVPKMMQAMIPELPQEFIYGVNFSGQQDEKVLKECRAAVVTTMQQALNFEGSDVQKGLIAAGKIKVAGQQADKPESKKEEKKAEEQQPLDFDDFDEDIPF